MKPLQSIAMGLVIIAVSARINGDYDVLADPVGWLLVLQGLGQLPAALPHRPALSTLGSVALVISVVLWFPSLAAGLEREDVALLWAAALPQLAFVALLCRALATIATGPAAGWLATAAALTVAAAAVVTVVLATDGSALAGALALTGSGSLLLVIVLLFRYASRPWALAPAAPLAPADGTPAADGS